jgi:site-specific recombinase XerD
MFQDVCERAGLGRDWAPRDLRRTFVSLLSDDGMAIEKIARLVGHASSHVTETVCRHELRPVLQEGAENDGPALRQGLGKGARVG